MLKNILTYISDFFILLLIFSFFNDNFMVERGGENILKLLFLVFYAFYFLTFIKNFKSSTTTQFKLIFIFLAYLFILLLVELFLGWNVDFAPAGSALIAIFAMVLYFSHYPINKLLYMIWIAVMASVVMSHFNHPVSEWTFRTSGGTEDPNEFAAQLLAFFFASIYLYTHNRSKLFLITSLLFFTYGLFKAGSMSSFLVLGIVGTVNIIRLLILKPNYFFNAKMLLFITVLSIASTQIEFAKIEGIQNMLGRTKDTGTADFRMHSWVAGKHMVETHPIFGVGADAFARNEPLYEEGHMIGSAPAPHNIYVKLIAESGIPAFLFFIFFILYMIASNIKVFFYRNEWLILSSLFSLLLMGITLGIFYDKYLWIFIILVMNLNHQIQRKGYIS